MPRAVLGLDIGGANLKAAHSNGQAILRPFALWKDPARLDLNLRAVIAALPAHDLLAVTMTGELCDCFETKQQGVHAILDAVESTSDGRLVRVWQSDGRLVHVATARATPKKTAAANWLALAEFAARSFPSPAAVLMDIGSTTTDVIPLVDGKPVPAGRTDLDRLGHQELVYTGVRRTPLCALLGKGTAAEWFATTLDAYLFLGHLPENADDRDTADGRPATKTAAVARLARMLCADANDLSEKDIRDLAREARDAQMQMLRRALIMVSARLPMPLERIILAGSGEFLGRMALKAAATFAPFFGGVPVISLGEAFGPEISRAACAFALARLAVEHDLEMS
jgi:probable H4MPT-linked C1 transfer pathway protein